MFYAKSYIEGLDKILCLLDLSELKGCSVLVTGASGLIGSALCDLLLYANKVKRLELSLYFAGRRVSSLKERFSYWGEDLWKAVQYDALLPIDFSFHADYIIHCASNAHPKMYVEQPVETIVSNVTGTANILAYARDTKCKCLLYISSSEVYGNRDLQQLYKESDNYLVDILNPRSCYPNSKRVCETLCAAYSKEYGVKSVIARPGHIFGPTATKADSRAHAQFAREAAMGKDIVMKSLGNQLRSYMYCTDCAAALLTVLLRGQNCEAYNIGAPGSVCTIRELAEMFAEAAGVHVVNDIPTKKEVQGFNLMSCSALDCSKLSELGFSAVYSIFSGVESCLNCLQESEE